jgi:hypothetical protein
VSASVAPPSASPPGGVGAVDEDAPNSRAAALPTKAYNNRKKLLLLAAVVVPLAMAEFSGCQL